MEGCIKDLIPNINELINKKIYEIPIMLSFEEQVQNNLRKIYD